MSERGEFASAVLATERERHLAPGWPQAERERLLGWPHDKRQPEPVHYVEDTFRRLLLQAEGIDAEREGLRDTPARAARAWRELTAGYRGELDLTTFDADGYDEIVAMRGLPFHSLCEHHILPFHGTADFAYLPRERILGLSKFSRLLDHYSRRLQVQERLTAQLADHLVDALQPRATMVVVRAEHLCMAMRGVQRQGASAVTSVVRGEFKDSPAMRAEVMELLSNGY